MIIFNPSQEKKLSMFILDYSFITVVFTVTRKKQKGVCCKLVFLFQELPNNGVMLVYVSGDGCPGNAKAGEEGTWVQKNNHYWQLRCIVISVISLFNNALFISVGPYDVGGVAMSHKKAGNEEAARRLRTNLKDVHWYVAFVLCQNWFWHRTVRHFFTALPSRNNGLSSLDI